MKSDAIKIIELETKLDFAEWSIDSAIKHIDGLVDIYKHNEFAYEALVGARDALVNRQERLNKMPGGKDGN